MGLGSCRVLLESDEYFQDFALREANYQKQLVSKDHDIEMIKASYEDKIKTIKKKSRDEVSETLKGSLDRQVEDRLSVRRDMKTQQVGFDKIVSNMRNEFDKKIMSIKGNNEAHVTKLTNRYEDIIKRERSESTKNQKRSESMMNGELQKISRRHELEKDSLITMYEIKLAKLKEANRATSQLQNTRESSGAI